LQPLHNSGQFFFSADKWGEAAGQVCSFPGLRCFHAQTVGNVGLIVNWRQKQQPLTANRSMIVRRDSHQWSAVRAGNCPMNDDPTFQKTHPTLAEPDPTGKPAFWQINPFP
jgi:hypothetical protein